MIIKPLLREGIEIESAALDYAHDQLVDEWGEEVGEKHSDLRGYRIDFDDDDALWDWVSEHLGIQIPREQICEGHVAPFTAFADAYFARHSRCVWKASRGFGGKTVMLATLSVTEAICLGASVNLLGGSGEQAQRAHEYTSGNSANLPHKFWDHPNAPTELLLNDPTKRDTKLANGGGIHALMASPKSVRGPHPQRLRGDEIDEMDEVIWDAAQGQPMESRGIREQVVGSSTHQHPDGTMTREIKMAIERGWPVYEWCYRETMGATGFTTQEQIDRKRTVITVASWDTEYEGQEPSPEGRAIDTTKVEKMFNKSKGIYLGEQSKDALIFEPPVWELHPSWKSLDVKGQRALKRKMTAEYALGADWGKLRDHTVVWVFRIDVDPMRVVAFANMVRLPYPIMFGLFNELVERYEATSAHDATGLGTVADDYVEDGTIAVSLVGARRTRLFSEWVRAIEGEEVVGPMVEYGYSEHRYCRNDDLYGSGHPPDSFVAAALTYHAAVQAGKGIM